MPSLIRHLRLLAATATCLFGSAILPAQEMELIPNGPVTLDERTGEVIATNGAQIVYGDWMLYAETIRYNQKTGEANAKGKVVFSRHDLRLIADALLYKPTEQYIKVNNFRAGNGRAYVDGSLLEGNPNDFKFNDVNFYPGEPGTFLFEARAGEVALINQNEIQGKRLFFKVGPFPFLLIPTISQPLDAETNLFKPTLDYSGHIGSAIGAEALVPVTNRLRIGGNVALTTKRGILVGPAARYAAENEDYTVNGSFISGYIKDSGDPGVDVNGRSIDDQRYFAEWNHKQRWAENRANLAAYLRYWSDSEVTRDFYEESFETMQDPDSYLEANYNADNWQLSLFTRAAVNDFQGFTERLPELSLSLHPTTISQGLTQQGFLSASILDKDPYVLGITGNATRLDAYYGWEYNQDLRDGVRFGLKAGARGIRYDNATRITGYPITEIPGPPATVTYDYHNPYLEDFEAEAAFGELGAELAFKAFSQIDFQNKTWDITGLRHIVEPIFSYRYTPEFKNEFDDYTFGPEFDTLAFSNFQSPLDLEDRRDVDRLNESQKVRFELRNRIQTRHRNGSSRDLARFSLASDYYLSSESNTRKYSSLVYTDIEVSPADWIKGDMFIRFDPEDSYEVREFNSRITIQDKGYWKIGFGVHFLDQHTPPAFLSPIYPSVRPYISPSNFPSPNEIYAPRLEQYYALIERNLNENLKLYAVARYDDHTGVFYEQRIGLMQRALERYGLKYEIRFYDGDRREDDFGVSIGVDLFDD